MSPFQSPTSLFRTKNYERKYIDLIKEPSGKWPNWVAGNNIRAGDFGTLDEKMESLIVEGNIYTYTDIAHIASQYPVIEEDEADPYILRSREVQELDVKADHGTSQGVIMRRQWQFNEKRGAILIMSRPRSTRVPDGFFTASRHLRILKNKCIVSQNWDCSGYYMYLSNKSCEKVTVTLCQEFGMQTSPNVNSSPSMTFHWVSKGRLGLPMHGYEPDGVYTPLFCMRSLRKPLLLEAMGSCSICEQSTIGGDNECFYCTTPAPH